MIDVPQAHAGRARHQEGQGRCHRHRRRRQPPRHRAELRPQAVAQLHHRHARHRRAVRVRELRRPGRRGRRRPRHARRRHDRRRALNGIGIVRRRAGRHARQRARRPGHRLLLPQRRPSTRSPTRATPASTSSTCRSTSTRGSTTATGGAPEDTAGAGGRAGRHHRDDEPGPRLRPHARASPSWRPSATTTTDLANPRTDISSPDYPGGTEHARTIDNANCVDLPVEGPHVIGVSARRPVRAEGRLLELRHRPHLG